MRKTRSQIVVMCIFGHEHEDNTLLTILPRTHTWAYCSIRSQDFPTKIKFGPLDYFLRSDIAIKTIACSCSIFLLQEKRYLGRMEDDLRGRFGRPRQDGSVFGEYTVRIFFMLTLESLLLRGEDKGARHRRPAIVARPDDIQPFFFPRP